MKASMIIPVLVAAVTLTSAAADPADQTAKMREQLRATMLQLRTAQAESNNLRVAQAAAEAKTAEAEAKVKALEARNEKLAKEINDNRSAADKTVAGLHGKVTERERRIADLDAALAKWKVGYEEAAKVARTKESERAALAAEVASLKLTVADRERKNIALFNTSMEILERFENYALGKALGAREPFIGTMRTKVENLVQGYKDRILDARLSAPPPKPAAKP